MNTEERRSYSSPLRESQTQQTRELILQGVAKWMQESQGKPFTLEAVAKIAGVQVRTLHRHFETKEDLLRAFWAWINLKIGPNHLPTELDALIELPRANFRRFDEFEGVIRGSLHSEAGKEMRHSALAKRREAVDGALDQIQGDLSNLDRQRLGALFHLLISASAWETMRDYAGISGEEAGDAAAWALQVLVQSQTTGKQK